MPRAFFDGIRSERLPANLLQARRDEGIAPYPQLQSTGFGPRFLLLGCVRQQNANGVPSISQGLDA